MPKSLSVKVGFIPGTSSPVFTPLPAQPFNVSYSDALSGVTVADWGHPGALVIAGQNNFAHQKMIDIATAGGTVLLYLDVIVHNATGYYQQQLINSSVHGSAVPDWPGPIVANTWGNLLDFRTTSRMHQPSDSNPAYTKLEAVLEQMVADNPHMGGFFADDLGSRSWFPGVSGSGAVWDLLTDTEKAAYRAGAIEVSETFSRVAVRHNLIFIVNGTWQAGDPLVSGGGYPNANIHGLSLADGGMIENHALDEFWNNYAVGPQWATASLTGGQRFCLLITNTTEQAAWQDLNILAYISDQGSTDPVYNGNAPWSSALWRNNGLPNGVT